MSIASHRLHWVKMYARYVPGKAKPASSEHTPAQRNEPSHATRQADDNEQNEPAPPKRKRVDESTIPKRYHKKRRNKITDEDIEAEIRAGKVEKSKKEKAARSKGSGDGESKKKSKKDKKQRDEDATMADADEEDAIDKKKKRKKEKVKKAREPESESDDEIDPRHKAVLDRKSKSLKLAVEAAKEQPETVEEDEAEKHGLEPLPQPEQAPEDKSKPTYDTLPSWLSAPIRVSQSTRTSFADIGILPKAASVLQEKGYADAFAVQTAAIPILLPTSKHRPGDLLVSAATGSGKTLAYALPIVRDLSLGSLTRLRALVVLPTRELVRQAQEVFELCAKAYEGGERKRVRVGVSIGSQSMKYEQDALIESESRYDPEEYEQIRQHAESATVLDTVERDPRLGQWEGEVVDFNSKVDVLICTPGRLVEHMEQTPGFGLDYVRWLVVDEADKLLAQSFQGWLDIVMEKFQSTKFGARDFPDMAYTGVRKIILSATLTRDLSLLNQLGLRRPQLIVLDSDAEASVSEHVLPGLLKEFAIRVHDANLKPLYLLELLRGQQMVMEDEQMLSKAQEVEPTAAKTTPDSSADSGSDSSSEDSSSDESESDSESSSDDSSSDSSSDSESSSEPESSSGSPAPSKSLHARKSKIPTALIFTKSNESALRLSRLLTLLDESLTPHISTITSTTPTSVRRKALRAFATPSSPTKLIIASDLVGRGVDIPNLGHVINYDLPPSLAGYVHRVGRTARAGRPGCAWTLVGDGESGWFWGKIAKGTSVRRPQKVARVLIEEMPEDKVEEYEKALEKLGKEAFDTRKK